MKINMSKKEARKITIIEELLFDRITNKQAAGLLDLSIRQIQRLKAEAIANGVINILHKNRGSKPSNALDPEIVEEVVKLYRTEFPNYNFCHVTDILAEEKDIYISVSSVSRHLKAAGFSSPKAKRRPKKHHSRDAREREGELVQMDASSFDWFDNGTYFHLHGAIDDATGRILALHLEKEETFEGYCELMFQMNQDHHLPRELYTDARTVFVYNSKNKQQVTIAEQLAGKPEKQPHFSRALRELNILLIIAKSPQAKGSIERLWETLQDRLVKDMKRKEVTTPCQANSFFKQYIPYYNRKFAVQASNPEKAYLPKRSLFDMQLIFSKHETRKLNTGLTFSFNGIRYRLPVYVDKKRIAPSPHDTVIVANSKYLGLRVLYKNFIIIPESLKTPLKISLEQSHKPLEIIEEKTTQKRNNSTWFKHVKMIYLRNHKGDIIPDELST